MSEQKITVIKTDPVTKVVLTAIAIFLGIIAVNDLIGTAHAMGEGACGLTKATACYVTIFP